MLPPCSPEGEEAAEEDGRGWGGGKPMDGEEDPEASDSSYCIRET